VRVLHVVSDWKWTGPAEPMLLLAGAQRGRGDAVALACPEPPAGEAGLAERACAAGLAPALLLERGRGARPWRDRRDARRLRAWLRAREPDVIHAWHTRDHVLAWRARRGLARAPGLVRSWPRAERIAGFPWNRWLLARASDGVAFPSAAAARANAALLSGTPAAGVLGAVDLERFAPAPPDARVRAALGLAPGAAVLGVVARVQARRRFDLLLEAFRRLATGAPDARLLVVGRGTRLAELAREPAERLGLGARVVFAGHRDADYPDVLRAIDVLVYLVPGSDGSCRAVLEAAACGIPAVTSRRGALPELVRHGETGLVVDEDAGALAAGMARLLADPALRAGLGAAARARAGALFAPFRLAERTADLYARALARRRAPPRSGAPRRDA
jgi:glycosyltransferase involved in cell wall biosynthesis